MPELMIIEDIHTSSTGTGTDLWDLVRIDTRTQTATIIGRYDDHAFADGMRRAENLMTAAADLPHLYHELWKK